MAKENWREDYEKLNKQAFKAVFSRAEKRILLLAVEEATGVLGLLKEALQTEDTLAALGAVCSLSQSFGKLDKSNHEVIRSNPAIQFALQGLMMIERTEKKGTNGESSGLS